MKKASLAALLWCAACAAPAAEPPLRAVEIPFALELGGVPVRCGQSYPAPGRGQAPVRLRDARFYVSAAYLIDAAGERVPLRLAQDAWQYLDVALIDFEDGSGGESGCQGGTPELNTVLRGRVPDGTYAGLVFDIGVPVEGRDGGQRIALNHSSTETAPPPLDVVAMGWSWQVGRKFVKIELLPQGGVVRQGGMGKVWTLHLGSTGCAGNPAGGDEVACSRSNRVAVALPGFQPGRDRVVLDLDALFAGLDLGVDGGGASGCMSGPTDPECGPIFSALGLAPSGAGVAPAQRAFRREVIR